MAKSTEYHFDIEQIICIQFTKERPSNYVFYPAEPAKSSFFGICKTPATDEGWVDESSWGNSRYTLEELKNYGYVMRNGVPSHKSHATAYLSHKCQVSKTFETEQEGYNWINGLKTKCNKTFEII